MSNTKMTDERLAELHESARYAKSHGNGQVSLAADELLQMLPALPDEQRKPTNLELCAKELKQKEAAAKPAADSSIKLPEPLQQGQKAPDSVDPGPLVKGESHAEAVAEKIHEATGAQTEVENGIPEVVAPAIEQSAPQPIPEAKEKTPDAAPGEPSEQGDPKATVQ